jgi:hypothetical protein
MKLKTKLKILSFIVNFVAMALLINGVGKYGIIIIVFSVAFVNYYEGVRSC